MKKTGVDGDISKPKRLVPACHLVAMSIVAATILEGVAQAASTKTLSNDISNLS